ncbi:tRNA synthetases class II family protein, partial [Chlamydia psittaci 84-8471/1]
NSVLHKL